MLLPLDRIAYDLVGGRILPTWLRETDHPFIDAVLDAVAAFSGLTAGEVELASGKCLAAVAREHRLPPRLAEGVWAVERRRWEAKVDAVVEPEALRDVLFELAARHPREEAIAEAARRLGISAETVVQTLFADRPTRRVLTTPPARPRAVDVAARYNVAVAQSLVARSMELEATLGADRSAVLAAAKRDGLLAQFEDLGEEMRVKLAGPLCIFRATARYGRSIARFLPTLLAATSWTVRARIMLGTGAAELELASSGAVIFPEVLPAAPDGRLARRVARALRSVGVRVDLQPPVARVGKVLVVPDFALAWSERRVLVDVVPFATPEYLASKAEIIAKIQRPMLVCVDGRYASLKAPWLLPYRGEVDPWVVLAAAQRLALEEIAAEKAALSAR
jgi:predicted nuclease of restriction endonuclease-like RecB superfamily